MTSIFEFVPDLETPLVHTSGRGAGSSRRTLLNYVHGAVPHFRVVEVVASSGTPAQGATFPLYSIVFSANCDAGLFRSTTEVASQLRPALPSPP